MRYKVIKKDDYIFGEKRAFNSLKQAIEYIKNDVNEITRGGFYTLIDEQDDGLGTYKATYKDKYNRARVMRWRIIEA